MQTFFDDYLDFEFPLDKQGNAECYVFLENEFIVYTTLPESDNFIVLRTIFQLHNRFVTLDSEYLRVWHYKNLDGA